MAASSLYLIGVAIATLWASFASAAPFEGRQGPGPDFKVSSTGSSPGGKADCFIGTISVPIESRNRLTSLSQNLPQAKATEIIQELFQANSDIVSRLTMGSKKVKGTFDIASVLCLPNTGRVARTVQILTHGIGLDKFYWFITPKNSYIDAAAKAGYATLSYDRLGVGGSDHPNPINVVQSFAHVEVLHGLAQGLRQGKIAAQPFEKIVGVGHSYGSTIQLANNAKYPADMDASVITGLSDTLEFLSGSVLSTTPAIANQDPSERFRGFADGYLVNPNSISMQQPFFRYPYYSQEVFEQQVAHKGTYSIGDEFTLAAIFKPAPDYTGPVDVVLGERDFPFCLADCVKPTNRADAVLTNLYPSRAQAGSQSFIVKDTGHLINDHTNAPVAYNQINKFLRKNNL
ncbi:MAG: hypothetical protein M1831_002394 [Alyxoria varia]|nr:MAG: hypothetical protein M1831_002394 [Alyxoria varia]